MHKLFCRFSYTWLDVMPARVVWVEQLIDAGEQAELAKTPENASVYATLDVAKTFVKDNSQQAVEIIARQLAVRDTFLREQEANDELMYLVQLKIGQIEGHFLAELEAGDPNSAAERLQILKDTALALEALIGTDTTPGVATVQTTAWGTAGGATVAAGAGAAAGYYGSVAAGTATFGALGGGLGLGTLAAAGSVALAVPVAVASIGSFGFSQYRKHEVNEGFNRVFTQLDTSPQLLALQTLIDNPSLDWEDGSYEIGQKGGLYMEDEVSVNMVDNKYAKPKIELYKALFEVMENQWVKYEMTQNPGSNRIKSIVDAWLAQNTEEKITQQHVEALKAQLFAERDNIVREYGDKVRDALNRRDGIQPGIDAFKVRFSDFDPALTTDDKALLTKPLPLELADIPKIEALELKVRTAAKDYLVAKLDPTTTGFPNPSNAFTRAEALRSEIQSLTNLTAPDVGHKLILWAEQAKDIFDDYEQEKQITALTAQLAAAQAELDALRPENEALKQEKEALQQEVDRLKGEITAQKGAIDALTAEIEELQRKIKELEGRNTPPAAPGEPDRPGTPPEGGRRPPAVREAREDKQEALHHIAREFFMAMEGNISDKRHVERKNYDRKVDSLNDQSYAAVEKFVQIVHTNYSGKPSGKDVKAAFKEAGLKKVGIALEQNEAIHSFQYANAIARALHDLHELGVDMHQILPSDNGKGYGDINGSTGAVCDQVEVFLKPHFSHKED